IRVEGGQAAVATPGAAVVGGSRPADLPAGLEGDGVGLLLKAARPTEVSGHFAPDAKRGIQTPVRVVARQGEVETGRSRHDDPAVGLEGEAPGALRATEASEHATTLAKREIQGAVRVVARQGEVETEKQKGRS